MKVPPSPNLSNLSDLHKRKLARARYKLRSHTKAERDANELALRNRRIPQRTPSNTVKLIRRTRKRTDGSRGGSSKVKSGGSSKVKSSSGNNTNNNKVAVSTTTPEANNKPKTTNVIIKWKENPTAWAVVLLACAAAPRNKLPRINHPGAVTKRTFKRKFVDYISVRPSLEKRGGYTIGSDPSSDFVIQGSGIMPKHCILYSQVVTDNQTGKASLKPYLSNLSSSPIYVKHNKKGDFYIILPQQSIDMRPEYQIYFTHKFENEPCLVFINRNFYVPSFDQSYTLGKQIGSGYFADVHEATDNKTGEVVAVKILSTSEFKRTPDTLTQFMREVGTMMSLDPNPGIVNIRNIYDEYGSYYIVMDYAPRGELYKFIKSNRQLSESTTRVIFYQLLSTVKFLHDRNIVHRDIKPENILLANNDTLQVKLCDFGLATLHFVSMKLLTICGTPVYVAPEILTRKQSTGYGSSCDIWSLGVVLYTCLHGYPPFFPNEAEDHEETFEHIKKGQFQFFEIQNTGKTVSEEAKDLISRLLIVDPRERISLRDALNHPWMQKEKERTIAEIAKIDKIYLSKEEDDKMVVCH